jgi:hypothetical protein
VKASRAYIASLGTSGVLIAFFLLLLAVVSAIVAFRGYPGEASNDGLDRLDVRGSRQAAAVSQTTREASRSSRAGSLTRRKGGVRGGRVAGRSVAVRDAKGLRSEGGVAGGRADGGSTLGGGGAGSGNSGGGKGNGNGLPSLPVGRDGGSQLPQAPSAGDVVGGIGNTVDDATGGLGGNVGRAAPPLEAPVGDAGEAVGGAIERTAPAVDEVVGGVTEQVGGVTNQVGGGANQVGGGAREQVEGVTGQVGGVTGGLP